MWLQAFFCTRDLSCPFRMAMVLRWPRSTSFSWFRWGGAATKMVPAQSSWDCFESKFWIHFGWHSRLKKPMDDMYIYIYRKLGMTGVGLCFCCCLGRVSPLVKSLCWQRLYVSSILDLSYWNDVCLYLCCLGCFFFILIHRDHTWHWTNNNVAMPQAFKIQNLVRCDGHIHLSQHASYFCGYSTGDENRCWLA